MTEETTPTPATPILPECRLAETVELAPGVFTLNLSHTYAAEGSFPVTVTVSDEDGGLASDTLSPPTWPAPSSMCSCR